MVLWEKLRRYHWAMGPLIVLIIVYLANSLHIQQFKGKFFRPIYTSGNIAQQTQQQRYNQLLMRAVRKGDVRQTSDLLSTGLNPNLRSKKGKTLLNIATDKNFIEMVHLLLDKGADVNLRDYNGNTPIQNAVDNQNREIVKLLLTKNPSLNDLDSKGRPILGISTQYSDDHRYPQTYDPEIFHLLIKAGADINAEDGDGNPILLSAALNGFIVHHPSGSSYKMPGIRDLVTAGADVNATDNKGIPILFRVVDAYCVAGENELVTLGAKVNIFGPCDESLYNLACRVNNCEFDDGMLGFPWFTKFSLNFREHGHYLFLRRIRRLGAKPTKEEIERYQKTHTYSDSACEQQLK